MGNRSPTIPIFPSSHLPHVPFISDGIDVEQGDFVGHNKILVPNGNPTPHPGKMGGIVLPRIVLVDYNSAWVKCRSSDELGPRPTNPAMKFWRPYLWEDIAGWNQNT